MQYATGNQVALAQVRRDLAEGLHEAVLESLVGGVAPLQPFHPEVQPVGRDELGAVGVALLGQGSAGVVDVEVSEPVMVEAQKVIIAEWHTYQWWWSRRTTP